MTPIEYVLIQLYLLMGWMWNMERELSRMTLHGFWLEKGKDGDVINRDVKTVGRADFWGEFRNSFPDCLGF